MKEQLQALLEELQRRKRSGETVVAVSDETLALLRAAAAREPKPAATARVDPPSPATSAVLSSPSPRVEKAAPISNPYAGSSGREAAASFGALVAGEAGPSRVAPRVAARAPLATPQVAAKKLPPPPVVELPAGTKRERWEWLRRRVLECPTCRAHTHGDFKVVFGVGNIDASIFFCGEAPGADEEIQGEPFVGPAGQLLDKMIAGMGLKREDVYIGNILNWRPEMEARASGRSVHQSGNRPPTEEEISFGLPYLRAQLEVVQPKVIVALGNTAAQGLLGFGRFPSLGAARGRWHEFNGTPLRVTYHPSYLLRNQAKSAKRMVWEDLLAVMEKTGLPISEKQRGFFL